MFFKTIYYIFLTALVVIGGLFLVSVLPIPGNIDVKIVQSGSMEPAIKVGSVVVIKPSKKYDVNDVITFGKDTKEDVPTTHRIIDERVVTGTPMYTTKGDANEDKDIKEVRESEIIGKVLISIPFLGYILDFAKKPLGFALLIGIPAVIVIFDEVANIFRETKKLRKKKNENEEETNE